MGVENGRSRVLKLESTCIFPLLDWVNDPLIGFEQVRSFGGRIKVFSDDYCAHMGASLRKGY